MSEELNVFTEYYSALCDTVTDVDNLLPQFVQKKVVAMSDHEEIMASSTKKAKVQKLMIHVSGPLRAGNAEGFHSMLRIMEEHGHKATQQLANQIRRSLHENITSASK